MLGGSIYGLYMVDGLWNPKLALPNLSSLLQTLGEHVTVGLVGFSWSSFFFDYRSMKFVFGKIAISSASSF